jgi:putative serine protease PepD
MSENEMNPQPAGEQPASTGGGNPPSPEPQGWRPPSDPVTPATPPVASSDSSQWPPAPSAPESTPATTVPVESAPVPSAPVESTPAYGAPAESTPAGFPTTPYPASPYQGAELQGEPATPYASGADQTAGAGAYPTGNADATGNPYATGAYAGDTPAPTYPSAGYPTSSYPATGTHEPRGGRAGVGRIVLLSALGLVLAVGGGVVGGVTTHHFDKSNSVTVNSAGQVVDNAPIVDRSSLASIASAVSPSVVSINTQDAEGSGVILSSDGYILTNNHVAATASGQSVQITFSTGSNATATLVGTDPKTDLAVYKAENVSNLTPAKFGDSSALQVGDTVLAIGSPLGLDGSVTAGIVSALNRTIDESADADPNDPTQQQPQPGAATPPTIAGAIQTDAAINPGNSGGALVNTNGEVVGINTAIDTNGADGSIGVGFSIPSNRAKQVADDLIKGVKVSHPQLGVGVTDAADNAGAQIGSVTAGSAAAAAGIKTGDVITEFNGQAVHNSDDLLNDVQGGTVGTSYALTVVRGGQTLTINVTLKEAS